MAFTDSTDFVAVERNQANFRIMSLTEIFPRLGYYEAPIDVCVTCLGLVDGFRVSHAVGKRRAASPRSPMPLSDTYAHGHRGVQNFSFSSGA